MHFSLNDQNYNPSFVAKVRRWIICLCLISLGTEQGVGQSLVARLDSELQKLDHSVGPNPDLYEGAYFLVSEHYESFTKEQRMKAHQSLKAHPLVRYVKMTSVSEAGTRIRLTGTVKNRNNKPVADAEVTLFQADANGAYAPSDAVTKRMSENDARLFGYLKTDAAGAFEIETVQPGNYPFLYEGSHIPGHLHFNVSAQGYADKKLQVVFSTDPSMQETRWSKWAKDMDFPVIQLKRIDSFLTGTFQVVLDK